MTQALVGFSSWVTKSAQSILVELLNFLLTAPEDLSAIFEDLSRQWPGQVGEYSDEASVERDRRVWGRGEVALLPAP